MDQYLALALSAGSAVDRRFILDLNRLALAGFPEEPESGQYRTSQVVLKAGDFVAYLPAPPDLIDHLMERLFEEIAATSAGNAQEAAASAALGIIRVHPFLQGNGRVARATASYILRRSGYVARGDATLEDYFDAYPSDYYGGLRAAYNGVGHRWRQVFGDAVESVFRGPSGAN